MQKRQSSHQCLFGLLGPTNVKAAYKMLVKLTPGAGAVDLRGVEAALEEEAVARVVAARHFSLLFSNQTYHFLIKKFSVFCC